MQNPEIIKTTVLGDVHDGLAAVLVEQDGERFIRKPRNAVVETALQAFLSRLREEGFLYLPGTVEILDADENQHTERIVEHLPLSSTKEAELYYKRCGALLFFTYLFSTVDLHSENIIACGAVPTVVDHETLLTGQIARTERPCRLLSDSVLASHLLPHWAIDGEAVIDHGGLSANGKNAPILGGKIVPAYAFSDAVAEGFRYAYTFAETHQALFSDCLSLFAPCAFRVMLRPTQLYASIGEFLNTKPEPEREETAYALLSRAYQNDADPDRLKAVKKTLQAEVHAVLHGEVPLFFTAGDGLDLQSRAGTMQENFLSLSPVDRARKKLNALCEADKTAQEKILLQALSASRPLEERIQKQTAEADALRIVFETLESTCLEAYPSGWMHLCEGKSNTLLLTSVGFGLYDGLLGILCAYAALYHKTKDERILNALLRHYAPARAIAIPKSVTPNAFDAGLQAGVGGHLQALLHIGSLTGASCFFEDAERLLSAVRLPNESAGSEEVLGGYGGLALALPKLNTPNAARLAEALMPFLQQAEPTLGGLAHGAAGIALALGAVSKVLHTAEADNNIMQLLRWENKAFDKTQKNWYDLRAPEKGGCMCGWCSGAPGIGMARQALKGYTDNAEIRAICDADLQAVRAMLAEEKQLKRDGLCCGSGAMLMAGSALGVPMEKTYQALSERVRTDSVRLSHFTQTCDMKSGLMQGMAGIGYALAMYGDLQSGGMLC